MMYVEITINGQRKYEYLDQYLVPIPEIGSLTKQQKQFNKEMEFLANARRDELELDIHRGKLKFEHLQKGKVNFIDFYESVLQKRKRTSVGNLGNWESALKHLKAFCPNGIPINEINATWLERFKDYLNKEARTKGNLLLSQNSRYSYFGKIRAAIKDAYRQKLIGDNPTDLVKAIPAGEPEREYLTIEDLRKLIAVPCNIPVLKNAFLFSCFTGLRWSDIQKLTWKEVRYSEEIGNYLVFRQSKTGKFENLPIPSNAVEFIGDRFDEEDRVFKGLKYSAWHNLRLQQWIISADIRKTITFHCARHTNAFLLLDNDVDIYTVSKMLGHKHLKTTEIYSHINDKRKKEAAKKIDFKL